MARDTDRDTMQPSTQAPHGARDTQPVQVDAYELRGAADDSREYGSAYADAAPEPDAPARDHGAGAAPYAEPTHATGYGTGEHHAAFVRERRPHHTQPPVNDMQLDDAPESAYAHESSYTLSPRRPVSSRTYQRSRSDVSRVKKELKYGQYLSVPKGSREIFGSRDKVRHRQLTVAVVALVAIAIVVALFYLLPH